MRVQIFPFAHLRPCARGAADLQKSVKDVRLPASVRATTWPFRFQRTNSSFACVRARDDVAEFGNLRYVNTPAVTRVPDCRRRVDLFACVRPSVRSYARLSINGRICKGVHRLARYSALT